MINCVFSPRRSKEIDQWFLDIVDVVAGVEIWSWRLVGVSTSFLHLFIYSGSILQVTISMDSIFCCRSEPEESKVINLDENLLKERTKRLFICLSNSRRRIIIYIYIHHYWLVVWNKNFIFCIDWEFHHPNWLSYFSEGLKPPTSNGFIPEWA